MTKDEKQVIVQQLAQMMSDNGGNRITLVLLNGFSITFGQFLDTLVVEEPKKE